MLLPFELWCLKRMSQSMLQDRGSLNFLEVCILNGLKITILSKGHKFCLLWVDVKANLVCSFLSLEHARNYDKEECISIWRSYLAKSLSYINATALTFIRRMPYALKILSIFLFCIESNAWRKSIKVGTAVRFDAFYQLSNALMPSINRLRVSMWPTVDLPGLNSF